MNLPSEKQTDGFRNDTAQNGFSTLVKFSKNNIIGIT
jgi:hypothetical protein